MLAVAAGLIWLGWSRIDGTLSGPHFEGYNLILGAIAIAQGLLTAGVIAAARWRTLRIARST